MFALAPEAAMAVAIVALLILLASLPLIRFLSQSLPDWRIPGLGSLRSSFVNGAQGAISGLEGWLDATLGSLASLISHPLFVLMRLFQDAAAGIESAAMAVGHTIDTVVPRAMHVAIGWAASVVNDARAYAHNIAAEISGGVSRTVEADYVTLDKAVKDARTYAHNYADGAAAKVQASVDSLGRTLSQDVAKTDAYATAAVRTLQATLGTELAAMAATVEGTVSGTVGAVVGQVKQLAGEVQSLAASAPSNLLGQVDSAAVAAVAGLWPDITTAVDGAISAAGTADGDIRAALGDVSAAIPTNLVGVLAGVGTISLAMTRYLQDCGIPNCRNLSGFGQELQSLLGFVEDAALLGLITYMVTDPKDAAADINNGLTGLASGVVSDARTLFGVS